MNNKINAFSILLMITIGLLISFLSFSAFNSNKTNHPKSTFATSPSKRTVDSIDISSLIIANTGPKELFGLPVQAYHVKESKIQKKQTLSTILEGFKIEPAKVAELVKESKSIFNVCNIVAGKPYTIFVSKVNPDKADYFVYQPNALEYIVYDLRDTVRVYKKRKEVETRIETIGGTINNSLYEALQENGADSDMAVHLAKIFGGVINFYAIKEGDWFKIQYERNYVENEAIGAGKIRSAVFSHNGKEFQAHYFQPNADIEGEYYDEKGNSLQRSFLKAPLKFSRISSRFTKRRLHPVQKVWKAHLGTDFAAHHGTPIIATGNGVVTESGATSGNGNYVKIQHNKTYTTQYLHMSRRAVKKGQRVKQGQVIGYVGSTGLATGPHVCYRFWKNGTQVDPLRQNIKMATTLSEQYKLVFKQELEQVQMELAVTSIEKAVEETRLAFSYEERPSELFQYFDIEDSANAI